MLKIDKINKNDQISTNKINNTYILLNINVKN